MGLFDINKNTESQPPYPLKLPKQLYLKKINSACRAGEEICSTRTCIGKFICNVCVYVSRCCTAGRILRVPPEFRWQKERGVHRCSLGFWKNTQYMCCRCWRTHGWVKVLPAAPSCSEPKRMVRSHFVPRCAHWPFCPSVCSTLVPFFTSVAGFHLFTPLLSAISLSPPLQLSPQTTSTLSK